MSADFAYDRVVLSSCNTNCGSRCPLRVYVKDDKVVRIEPDGGDDAFGAHQVPACLRGRAYRKWLYSPERLATPLRRSGPRGSGRFEPISWDQALDQVADSLRRIIDQYGNSAVYRQYGTGNAGGVVSGQGMINRLMNCLGGKLDYYNSYSVAQITHAMNFTYGEAYTGNHISDVAHSELVVFFGNNPAETRMSGGGSIHDLMQARENSRARFIVIDPRCTDTALTLADEWIAIRPGSDAALAAGLAHVLISRGLVDHDFLRRHCQGYDRATLPPGLEGAYSYRDYILGDGPDRQAKTPAWAAAITGIPAGRIEALALEIAAAKPAYIAQGWGPQRQAAGEQSARAIAMLAILTGNVGIRGGNSGDRESNYGLAWPGVPTGENPVGLAIPCFLWSKAIEAHREFSPTRWGLRGGEKLPAPIKFMWNFASNVIINQHSDVNASKRVLADESACEMIVAIDCVLSPSVQWADIVLPNTATVEESDLVHQGDEVEMGVLMLRRAAVPPFGQSRTLYDICLGLAERLGVAAEFGLGRSHDEWIEHIYAQCRGIKPELPADINEAYEKGIYKWPRPGQPKIGLESFRRDPEKFPLATPSGKIEIFSTRLWEMARTWELEPGERIPALPEYVATWGGPEAAREGGYPLQLIGFHGKHRTHSTYGNNPWLAEVSPDMLWINPLDAGPRGIAHGDAVIVSSPRGRLKTRAKLTRRIMPGVVALPQGAWHRADRDGLDRGGCINSLTSPRPTPIAKGNPQHTNLVQVERCEASPC